MSEIFSNTFSHIMSNSEDKHNSKNCVLVFSPEDDDLFLYKTVFGEWSYDVAEVKRVNDLLRTIELEKPKVILIDEKVDFEESLNVIKLIRQFPALIRTSLILISGYAQPHFREVALKSGVDEFFLKPVDFDKLEKSLERIVCPVAGGK